MNMHTIRRLALSAAGAALAFGGLATPANAQRDPAYEAARAAGQVGERMDGLLGVVGAGTPAIRAMVDDINIKRRQLYTERAKAKNATLEAYSITAGCEAIARTQPGEKYQAPDGSWQTRGAGAPQRDPRCP